MSKLSEKQFLTEYASKLKRVLHPTITREDWDDNEVIELVTDIEITDQYPISFYVKCLNRIDQNTKKTIFAQGFVVNNTGECTLVNMGPSKITAVASTVDEVIKIGLIPETGIILKTEAEVFVNDDNKNHLASINYVYRDDEYYNFQEVEGDADVNFHYTIDTGRDNVDIENGVNRVEPIDTIHHSIDAEQLNHPVYVKIKGVDYQDESEVIFESSFASINTAGGASTNIIKADVYTFGIKESVKQEVLNDFPTASDSQIGGIKTNTTGDGLGNKQFPVVLDQEDRAFVDLTNYQPSITADIHRFEVMPLDSAAAGTTLVQYIGQNTPDYTFGYYYKWAPTELQFNIYKGDGWFEIDHDEAEKNLLTYNINHDYILSQGEDYLEINLKDELEEGDAIKPETTFSIRQGDWFEEEITYEELNNLGFMLKDNPNYREYSGQFDYILSLEIKFTDHSWKQKNVQPMLKVGSPLIFKGMITANQGETDIEALERQVLTPNTCDFYIVLPSSQEYYWTGTEWEFMGQVVEVPKYTAGDAIDITNYEVSVKYDNNTIKKDNSGNLYVDGELTDTQADWNESDTTSHAYINNKPYVTVAQVLAKLNESIQQV